MKNSRRSITRLSALVALLSILAVTLEGGGSSNGEDPKPRIGKFTLIYNVNNSGYVDVCGCKHKKVRNGSLTRRASYLKQLRTTRDEVFLVDGGSTLFKVGSKPQSINKQEAARKAELIVEAYNRMGYRAMTVGVSDIVMGTETLKKLLSKAEFEVLSANMVDKESKELLFKPSAVFEVGGVKVGVVGLMLERIGSAYLESAAPDIEITDPIQAARREVEKLRGKADLIIALSHTNQETNYKLIDKLEDLCIVIDPFIEHQNHKTWIKEEEWLGVLDETLFLRSDGQGARLGVVDITVDYSGGKLEHIFVKDALKELVANGEATPEQKTQLGAIEKKKNIYHFERVSIGPHHRGDPDIDNLVAEWKKGIDPAKVTHLEANLPNKHKFLTAEKCGKCHERQYDFWQNTPHAQALASLEATNDQFRYDCIGCHSLGYSEAFIDTSKIGAYANVQCESCHGINPKHAELPKQHPFATIQEDACLTCHQKEHTLKDFHFFSSRRKMACPKS